MNRLNFSALLVAIFFAVIPSAQAHSSLISSEPSEGQSLNVIPQTLTLAFNEDLIENSLKLIQQNIRDKGVWSDGVSLVKNASSA